MRKYRCRYRCGVSKRSYATGVYRGDTKRGEQEGKRVAAATSATIGRQYHHGDAPRPIGGREILCANPSLILPLWMDLYDAKITVRRRSYDNNELECPSVRSLKANFKDYPIALRYFHFLLSFILSGLLKKFRLFTSTVYYYCRYILIFRHASR